MQKNRSIKPKIRWKAKKSPGVWQGQHQTLEVQQALKLFAAGKAEIYQAQKPPVWGLFCALKKPAQAAGPTGKEKRGSFSTRSPLGPNFSGKNRERAVPLTKILPGWQGGFCMFMQKRERAFDKNPQLGFPRLFGEEKR